MNGGVLGLQSWEPGPDTDDLLDSASLSVTSTTDVLPVSTVTAEFTLVSKPSLSTRHHSVRALREGKNSIHRGRSCDVHFTGFDLGERHFSVRDRRLCVSVMVPEIWELCATRVR